MRRIIQLLLPVFVFLTSSNGQSFPVKTIIENGPRENRINMVFLGDGYQITEMDKYEKDVQATVDKFFTESPYKEYKNLYNVYAIEVPSNESGADHPGTAADCPYKDSVFTRDTYFNTTFDYGNTHRLLVAKESGKVYQVLLENFPDYDMVMMVVNHRWYGGSGGSISVFSTNIQSSEIAIHEAGHSFAGLADEYDYGSPSTIKYDGINVTWRTRRDSIPWNPWILQSTPIPTPANESYSSVVGLFEGAYYTSKGMYRPKLRCKMRELNVPFCEVCKEQHVKSMFDYVDLIDSYLPEVDNVTVYTNGKTDFNVTLLHIPSKEITLEWALDDNILVETNNSISLDGTNLTIGKHTLSVTAKHNTEFVRNDHGELLESVVNWSIDVVNPTNVDEDTQLPREFVLEQNYPNPFNPSTTINFSIPSVVTRHSARGGSSLQQVILKVYDMLGREIAVLVNGEKTPGNYEVIFNAGHFERNREMTSGIYFYTLTAGSYSETKKMILLR